MKATRDTWLISGSALLMVFTLLAIDVYQLISFPFFGVVHWIPELCGIFLLSNYIAKKFDSKKKWSIFACTLAYPVLFFQSAFGILTASIFGSAMLLGFLSVDLKKFRQMKVKQND